MPETPRNRSNNQPPPHGGRNHAAPRSTFDGRPERRSGSAADRSDRAARQAQSANGGRDTVQYSRGATPYRSRAQADQPSGSNPRAASKRSAERGSSPRAQRESRASERYADTGRYRAQAKQRSAPPWKPVLAGLALLACIIGGVTIFIQSRPIAITVNDQQLELGGDKTIGTVIEAGYASPEAGDFVAVDGEVLEAGKGEAFTAYVNDTAVTDLNAKLSSGDTVTITDGKNITEPSQDTVEPVPYEVVQEGNGPLHVIEGEGVDGGKITKVGDISGKTFVEDIAPQNPVCRKYYPDTGEDKVVALTFDDGPWPEYTEQILDILKENDAKATFFTVGDRIDKKGRELVKRARDEGHQICTHSFDHAKGDGRGVDLGLMSAEQQIEEITKGYDAIREALDEEPSTVIRTPGGNFGAAVQKNLAPHISAEIGWNIDSSDWRRPGAAAIADQIQGAWPGAVILCHDGGGDRSQTVEAIRTAIPYLKEQGYRFITIDEMLEYPAKPTS